MMFMTDTDAMAHIRVENNIIPMLEQSRLTHIIQSSDFSNSRKTGKTKQQIQFIGGGYMIPTGSQSESGKRSFSICIMTKDEIDA